MEKEQTRHLESQTHKAGKSIPDSISISNSHVCKNCGATIEHEALFCEECGAPQTNKCISCGGDIQPGSIICPTCGHPATSQCTFCGSQMGDSEAFCSECGNSRKGIFCPKCSTLNFRSFCRKCNYPLNPMARYAVEEAHRDPHVIRTKKIANELAEIESEILQLEKILLDSDGKSQSLNDKTNTERILDVDDTISDETRRLLEEFRHISGQIDSATKQRHDEPETEVPANKPTTLSASQKTIDKTSISDVNGPDGLADQFTAAAKRLDSLKKAYASKARELQAELEAMIPPAGSPPEVRRNFVCSRKFIIEETKVERLGIAWICNKCGIRHRNPSECAVAEFGGKWIFEERVTTHRFSGEIRL